MRGTSVVARTSRAPRCEAAPWARSSLCASTLPLLARTHCASAAGSAHTPGQRSTAAALCASARGSQLQLPVPAPHVAVGQHHTVVAPAGGAAVLCWGSNRWRQCGDGGAMAPLPPAWRVGAAGGAGGSAAAAPSAAVAATPASASVAVRWPAMLAVRWAAAGDAAATADAECECSAAGDDGSDGHRASASAATIDSDGDGNACRCRQRQHKRRRFIPSA